MSSNTHWFSAIAVTLALVGCGGSGGGSSTSSSSAPTPSSSSASSSSEVPASSSSSSSSSSVSATAVTGVFVDSAVGGIGYRTTPGGIEGTTNSEGEYQFEEGDSVVFFIGDLELPAVAAKGIVTPLDIANTDDLNSPMVVNIARLLQSLDEDGDASNGISIPAAAASVATQVDFDVSVEDFAASEGVISLVANSGSTTTALISAEAATAHLDASVTEQRESLVGSWYYQDISDSDSDRQYHIVLTFLDDDRYIITNDENALDDDAGQDGFEKGSYTWNLRTGIAEFGVEQDTNGEWGFSHPCNDEETMLLEVRDDTLYLWVEGQPGDNCDEAGEEPVRMAFQRVASEADPLVGAWIAEGESSDNFMLINLTADGTYLVAESKDHVPGASPGEPGIERGTYTHDSETNVVLFVTLTDTNGRWGFSHSCASLDLVDTNNLACGPDGRDVIETFTVEGDTLIFVSEVDTILEGMEQPVAVPRVGTTVEPEEPAPIDLSGTWTVSVTEDATGSCGDTELYYYDDVYTVVQDGSALTVSEQYGTYQGSIDGFNLNWSGSYIDEDGTGTTTVTATFNTSGDMPTMSGSSTWTFDDGAGFTCSGTSTFTGQLSE